VKDALAQSRTHAPGLLILDLGLPDGSGFEVVAAFREDEALQGTPLLVYTGRDLSGEERRRLRLGRTRFLVKSRASDKELAAAAADLLGPMASPEPER
jgi:DNA-binding response OmpR family regulator